jgi:hypothetical protein
MQLQELIASQSGLVTRRQPYEQGVSAAAVAWRLDRGWRLVLPGVITCFTGTPNTRQRLVAAQLYAGEGTVITSFAAAAWHGLLSAAGHARVHVMVPADRAPREAGFVVIRRTSRCDPHAWERPPLRLAGPHRESRWARRAVQDAEAGAWSGSESELLRVLGCSSVPSEVWPNAEVRAPDGTRLPTPDGWIDDVALAIHVHSRRYHEAWDDWDRTVMADGVFAEYGIPVVGVTPARITRDPEGVLRRVELAYLAAARRPRPDVTARRLGHGIAS